MPSHDNTPNRAHNTWPKAIAVVAIVFQRAGIAVIVIAGAFALVFVSFQAGAPHPEGPPGSGIIERTEVTVVWIPGALRDVAQAEGGSPGPCFLDPLQAELKRRGLNDASYAVTCRGYQVDGLSGEITQIRRLSEAADHLDELHAVMATAAGRPPRDEGRVSWHARVEIIPEALQAVDPREAIARLTSEAVFEDEILPREVP
jgi:hypothetical protein